MVNLFEALREEENESSRRVFNMSPLPEGSLVLVSGCNGFIASHIVDQLLLAGYRVRGTVREQSKADWLKEYVAKTYNASDFEVAVVPDQGVTGAFDAAVKGMHLRFLESWQYVLI